VQLINEQFCTLKPIRPWHPWEVLISRFQYTNVV